MGAVNTDFPGAVDPVESRSVAFASGILANTVNTSHPIACHFMKIGRFTSLPEFVFR